MSPEDQELEIRELRQRLAERDAVIAEYAERRSVSPPISLGSQAETRAIMARLWERAASSFPSLASHAPEVGIEAAWVIVREAVACGLVDWAESERT